MNSRIENRRDPRIPVNWPVDLMTSQGAIAGETSNISISGALILCTEEPEIGDEFQIILKSSDNHKIPATCSKVWSGSFNMNGYVFNGIGVHFTEISSKDQEVIASLVAEQYIY